MIDYHQKVRAMISLFEERHAMLPTHLYVGTGVLGLIRNEINTYGKPIPDSAALKTFLGLQVHQLTEFEYIYGDAVVSLDHRIYVTATPLDRYRNS